VVIMSPFNNLYLLIPGVTKQANTVRSGDPCLDKSYTMNSIDFVEASCSDTSCEAKRSKDHSSFQLLSFGLQVKNPLHERTHIAKFGSSLSPAAEAELNVGNSQFCALGRNVNSDDQLQNLERETYLQNKRSMQAKKRRKQRIKASDRCMTPCNSEAKFVLSAKTYHNKDLKGIKIKRKSKSLPLKKRQRKLVKPNETNIADFITSLGEESGRNLTTHDVAKFMDRDLLRLSARWSYNIRKNCEAKQGSDEISHNLGSELNKISSSLSPACARDEVEGLLVLLKIESPAKSKKTNCWDEFDNTSLEEEISCLGQVQDKLNARLSRYEEVIYDSPLLKNQAETGFGGSTKSFGPHRQNRPFCNERQMPTIHRSKSLYSLCGLAQ